MNIKLKSIDCEKDKKNESKMKRKLKFDQSSTVIHLLTRITYLIFL
jgi:hypothetical protein